MIIDLLKGHTFYALVTPNRKKRIRGLKYMGQTPIYRTLTTPGISIHRVAESTDISKYEYVGLYDCGSTKIPMFKLLDIE